MLKTKNVFTAWVLAHKEHASDYHGYDATYWNFVPLLFADEQKAGEFLSLLKSKSDKIEDEIQDKDFYSPAQEPWDVCKSGVITQNYKYIPFEVYEISKSNLEILSVEGNSAKIRGEFHPEEEWRIFEMEKTDSLIEEFRIKRNI